MDGSITSFEYDKVGNRSKIIRSNGTDSHYSYNKANQLTSITHQKGSNTLAKFIYTLDENGRRIKAEEIINGVQRTVSYSYDTTGKLLEEKVQQGAQTTTTTYSYDGVGNRLSKVENGVTTIYNYNANDQLLSETNPQDTITYDWNANGNLIKKATPEGVITYNWNSSNKLIAIDDQINLRKVSYQHDGEDRRIGKVVEQNGNKTETQYLIDNERPYSEIVLERTRVNQGNWTETIYLHTPDGLGDLLTQDQTGQVNYLYQDGQGSTRFIADKQGATKSTYNYDAFGNTLSNTTSNIKHRYVGEYCDNDSGFYHLRARDYDPKIGRFISRDSFEGKQKQPISLNPYLYAHSDPTTIIDPSGHFGLGGMMAAADIRSILGNMQIDFGMNFLDAAINGEASFESNLGWGIILSLAPPGVKLFARSVKEIKIGSGVVKFAKKFPPTENEKKAALFLAERTGAKIFIRGENVQGADFIMNGVRFEHYAPKKGTSINKVSRGIRGKIERQGDGRMVLDIMSNGSKLKEGEVYMAIQDAISKGAQVKEVVIIQATGKITYWM